MYICTHTHTSFRNHDSNSPSSNPPLQGFFLAFPHSLFACPFFLSEDSGFTNSSTATHLFNLVTYLKQFQNAFLPTPLEKTKPTKKSSVLFILLAQLYPLLKVYHQITTFMTYLNLFFLNPFQCDCVIHLMYSSSVSAGSPTLVDFILYFEYGKH